jgi:hypothetical protein
VVEAVISASDIWLMHAAAAACSRACFIEFIPTGSRAITVIIAKATTPMASATSTNVNPARVGCSVE